MPRINNLENIFSSNTMPKFNSKRKKNELTK